MRQTSLAVAILLSAVSVFAQVRSRPAPFPIPSGATISGVVTRVTGSQIELADGLITIDVSQAMRTDVITAGSYIYAMLQPGFPLKASAVVVTNLPEVTITGTVDSVGPFSIQVLGLTIQGDTRGVTPGSFVRIEASARDGQLVASSVQVFPPVPQPPTLIHGTVKSIGPTSWVITDSRRGDVTVNVNSQTKITGSPKVGDTVDVIVSAGVAVSISISSPAQIRLTGVVKSISATEWVIGPAVGLGPDFLVQVNNQTRIIGNPVVGDRVEVLAAPGREGFVAVSITKL